jgi:hypothetical protein
MTKTSAVQAVFDEGFTRPKEVSQKVMEKFGMEVKPSHVSTIKNQLKKRRASGKGRKRKTSGGGGAFAAAVEYVQKVGGLDAAQEGLNMIRTAKEL